MGIPSIQEWKQKGAFLRLNGRRIFYIDTADGLGANNVNSHQLTPDQDKEAILLIHGFPTSSWDWLPIWNDLSAQYRLIAMDMLGFGYSDKPSNHSYSIHEQADIIEALVQDLGLTRFHVLAHDYGDTVAQELLARQNEGMGKGEWMSVCFLNGGLFAEMHHPLLIQKLLLSPIGFLVNKLTTRKRFDLSMARVFAPDTPPSQSDLDGFWALINYNEGRHIFHNLITYMTDRKTHRERWVGALKDAIIPIGLINGSLDPVSGAHMIAHYKATVGEPEFLIELPTIGHYPQVEASEKVKTHYLEFLNTRVPKA